MGPFDSENDPFGMGLFDGGNKTWDHDGDGHMSILEENGRFAFDESLDESLSEEDSDNEENEDDFDDDSE